MELSPQGLPVIDLSIDSPKEIAKYIAQACESTGCFYVKNHGIDIETTENTFRDLRNFFLQPVETKMRFLANGQESLYRGYVPFEAQNVNSFMGRQGHPNDPVEKYTIGPLAGYSENIWSTVPATLRKNYEDYYEKTRKLGEKLMKLFAIAAGAPSENYFYDYCQKGEHLLKAHFYPKSSSCKSIRPARYGEHTDISLFTILAMDDCRKALQAKNAQDEWVDADPIPGTLFVNLGDFMAIWTNDKWKATVHKVVWSPENETKDRLSLGYFAFLNPGTVVECIPSCVEEGQKPKYRGISHADYVKQKLASVTKGA